MLQKIHTFYQNHCRLNFKDSRAVSSNSGQIAIILVLVIALALVFYAVNLNLGQNTEVKTNITRASNMGASLLASQMASYGQKLFKEDMGGKLKRCKTSLLQIFLTIAAIVGAILAAPAGGLLATLATASAIISVATLVLQVTVIQPGMTAMWNKIQAETLTPKDNFLETGIQTALQAAVNDPVRVPDVYDMDSDGLFGFDVSGRPRDKISRFSIYYDKRIKRELALRDAQFIEDFRDLAMDLILTENDTVALHDPVGIHDWDGCNYHPTNRSNGQSAIIPSACNPCCMPPDAHNWDGVIEDPWADPPPAVRPTINMVPEMCDCYQNGAGPCEADEEIGTTATCVSHSPYGDISGSIPLQGTSRPNRAAYIYDEFYQNRENDSAAGNAPPSEPIVVSFLQKLGVDDENDRFVSVPGDTQQMPLSRRYQSFTIDDATSSVYRAMHYLFEWGLDLNSVTDTASSAGEHCYWHDFDGPSQCQSRLGNSNGYFPQLVLGQRLDLPLDPVANKLVNSSYQVDGTDFNPTAGMPPLGVDAVVPPAQIKVPIGNCSGGVSDDCWTDGLWKKGTDSFCSQGDELLPPDNTPPGTHYPYNQWCIKHTKGGDFCFVEGPDGKDENGDPYDDIPVPCECNESDQKQLWRDDAIDEIRMGLIDFIKVYMEIFESDRSSQQLINTIEFWYKDIAPYIETEDMTGAQCSVAVAEENCLDIDGKDGCDVEENPGRKYILQDLAQRMHVMVERLEPWLRSTSFASNEAWCVPEKSNCDSCDLDGTGGFQCGSCTDADGYEEMERVTFDYNQNDVQGDLSDVIACLDYNIEGYDFENNTIYPEGTRQGNDYRYDKCGKSCLMEDCLKLPRSQIGMDRNGFDTSSFSSGPSIEERFEKIQKYNACFDDCGSESCRGLPDMQNGFSQNYCSTWQPGGNVFYDELMIRRDAARLPADRDVNAFLTCLDSCSVANCMPGTALPRAKAFGDLVPYTYSQEDQGIAFTQNSCTDWRPGNPWWDDIHANMVSANPSCSLNIGLAAQCNPWTDPSSFGGGQANCDLSGSPAERGWLFNARHSALEARNQVVKFHHRRDFLKRTRGAVQAAIDTFKDGETRLKAFLTSDEIKELINYYTELDEDPDDTGHPHHVIYGWRGEPPPSRKNLPVKDKNKDKGYWHIVKVEAGIPLRCPGNCGPNWTAKETWPNVTTYTKGFLGTTKCYELIDRVGRVKVRVTRRDEAPPSSSLQLPNGMPIWTFRSQHAGRDPIQFPQDLAGKCKPITDFRGNTRESIYQGAFMLNDPYTFKEGTEDIDQDNVECWTRAMQALSAGVMSETCAEYFFHRKTKGFTHKFIPCDSEDW